jgi:hypothetical protein
MIPAFLAKLAGKGERRPLARDGLDDGGSAFNSRAMAIPEVLPTQYRYDLRVEIPATDVSVLIDGLDGEEFSLRDIVGKKELERRIREQDLVVEIETLERWTGLDKDIEVLSVYLSQYIVGRELVIIPTLGAPKIQGFLVIGRSGETARVALDVRWDPREETVIDEGEDVADLARRWETLPEWLRTAMRAKHLKLAAL